MRHLAVVCVLFLACSCKGRSTSPEFRLRIALVAPLAPVVPGAESSDSAYAQEWVFQALMRTGRDGSLIPGLADRFERLGTNRVRIQLRPGAAFSDGTPVTVDDLRRSLEKSGLEVHPEGPSYRIESASGVVQDATLRHVLIFKRAGDVFLGTGPFRVESQDATQVLLRRIQPKPGTIYEALLLGFPAAREAFAHTLAGDAQLLPLPDPKQLEFFKGVDRFRVVRGRGINAIAVAMGTKRLSQLERAAIDRSLPRIELSRILEGVCPSFPQAQNAGEKPRRRLDIHVIPNKLDLERMALGVARALGSDGGEIRIVRLDEFLPLLTGQDFDLAMLTPLVWPPSTAALVWRSGSPYNLFNYSNPKVDAAIDAGDWARALQELMDDPPVAFICTPERLAVVDARVKNPELGPYGLLETLPDWEVEE